MRTPPSNVSIRDIGLETYLNGLVDLHGGLKYSDFVTMIDKYKMNNSQVARTFGRQTATIRKWRAIHEEEVKKRG